MSRTAIRTREGTTTQLDSEAIGALRSRLRGAVCAPGEPGYDAARTLWNAMIDRRPALVARAAHPDDVTTAVRFAREHDLLVAVRSGGHNIAGLAVGDGAFLIDLSGLRSVSVDAAARVARVEAGATLGDLDHATQAHGLATPLGINSTTGVAGLTLGGGFGWLSRKHGLTIDNLVGADVVTADGERVRASATENPDLFWALRGGGGNFGVVSAFDFRLHPVGPEVLSGLIVHPFEDARAVLQAYRRVVAEAPDDLTCWVVLRKAPPLPFLPAEVHGREIVVLALCYAGPPAAGGEAVAPLRSIGRPIADVVGMQPYVAWQTAFDPLLTPGARNYWKSHDFTALDDATLECLVDFAGRLPTADCEIFVGHLGGAVNRVPTDATAYPHRDVEFVLNVHTRWTSPSQDRECIAWARAFYAAAAPLATGGVYVNFMPEDEGERVRAGAYGPNYERLVRVKSQYDPRNFFRMNHNIRPD